MRSLRLISALAEGNGGKGKDGAGELWGPRDQAARGVRTRARKNTAALLESKGAASSAPPAAPPGAANPGQKGSAALAARLGLLLRRGTHAARTKKILNNLIMDSKRAAPLSETHHGAGWRRARQGALQKL
jgi:hypothetical protein